MVSQDYITKNTMAPNAPSDMTKATPKVQRSVVKTITTKNRSSPRRPFASTTKKTISSTKKRVEKIPFKMNNTLVEPRRRTSTVPANTTQPKEKIMTSAAPESVKKPSWKRRPKHAHSGVPVPKKMEALKRELDDSL